MINESWTRAPGQASRPVSRPTCQKGYTGTEAKIDQTMGFDSADVWINSHVAEVPWALVRFLPRLVAVR